MVGLGPARPRAEAAQDQGAETRPGPVRVAGRPVQGLWLGRGPTGSGAGGRGRRCRAWSSDGRSLVSPPLSASPTLSKGSGTASILSGSRKNFPPSPPRRRGPGRGGPSHHHGLPELASKGIARPEPLSPTLPHEGGGSRKAETRPRLPGRLSRLGGGPLLGPSRGTASRTLSRDVVGVDPFGLGLEVEQGPCGLEGRGGRPLRRSSKETLENRPSSRGPGTLAARTSGSAPLGGSKPHRTYWFVIGTGVRGPRGCVARAQSDAVVLGRGGATITFADQLLHHDQGLARDHLAGLGLLVAGRPVEDDGQLLPGRVADDQLEHETGRAGPSGSGIRPLLLDGVLRRP